MALGDRGVWVRFLVGARDSSLLLLGEEVYGVKMTANLHLVAKAKSYDKLPPLPYTSSWRDD
jgi:hypothetical protein